MRASEIHGPVAYDCVIEPLHELRKMCDGKGTGNFAAFLALGQNLLEQVQYALLVLPHVRRTYRIHRTGQNHGLPQRAVRFCVTSQLLIQPAQMFGRHGLAGKLVSQVICDASKSSPPDLAQNRVFAREIAEERRLANLKGLHDIVNARLLIPSLAKQSNCSIYDLLAETCLLAFPEAERFFIARSIAHPMRAPQLCCKASSCRWRGPGSGTNSCDLRASHNGLISSTDERLSCGQGIYLGGYCHMRVAPVK